MSRPHNDDNEQQSAGATTLPTATADIPTPIAGIPLTPRPAPEGEHRPPRPDFLARRIDYPRPDDGSGMRPLDHLFGPTPTQRSGGRSPLDHLFGPATPAPKLEPVRHPLDHVFGPSSRATDEPMRPIDHIIRPTGHLGRKPETSSSAAEENGEPMSPLDYLIRPTVPSPRLVPTARGQHPRKPVLAGEGPSIPGQRQRTAPAVEPAPSPLDEAVPNLVELGAVDVDAVTPDSDEPSSDGQLRGRHISVELGADGVLSARVEAVTGDDMPSARGGESSAHISTAAASTVLEPDPKPAPRTGRIPVLEPVSATQRMSVEATSTGVISVVTVEEHPGAGGAQPRTEPAVNAGWAEHWQAVAPDVSAKAEQGTRGKSWRLKLPALPTVGQLWPEHRDPRQWLMAAAAFLTVIVLATAVAGTALYRQARTVGVDLAQIRLDTAAVIAALGADDTATAQAALVPLQTRTQTAREITSGALWVWGAHVPVFGDDVRAVQTAVVALDDLADGPLPDLVAVSNVVDPRTLLPADGVIDTEPLAAAAARISAALVAVEGIENQLGEVNTSRVLPEIAAPFLELRQQITQLRHTVDTASRAAQLLPAMLGADGPRHYLILAQTTAEQRSLGGIPGAVLLVEADAGQLRVLETRSGASLSGLENPVLTLDESETDLFGPLLGTDMRDVTFTPDFPRAAAMARGIWEAETEDQIDGVLSLDPTAVAALLKATGSVTVNGVTLTSQNASQELLSGVYSRYSDPVQQDVFLVNAAHTIFSRFAGGVVDAQTGVDALAQAAGEGRVMLWSAHPEEQQQISGTVLAGELVGARDNVGVLGVFLNDGTESKLGYYLDLTVDAELTGCTSDGGQAGTAQITLTSNVPENWQSLPAYVLGSGEQAPLGDIRTNVLLYAPAGGTISVDGESRLHAQVHEGLSVAATTVMLHPGQSMTFDVAFTTGPGHDGPLQIRSTPLAGESGYALVHSVCASE